MAAGSQAALAGALVPLARMEALQTAETQKMAVAFKEAKSAERDLIEALARRVDQLSAEVATLRSEKKAMEELHRESEAAQERRIEAQKQEFDAKLENIQLTFQQKLDTQLKNMATISQQLTALTNRVAATEKRQNLLASGIAACGFR